ncbi:MAG: TonB-dependent receptor, partial [Chitinophagaceae bacterium]
QFSWAQVRITVQTVDAEDGTPVSNASVQLKEVQTIQTNEEGLLFFSLKKPGTYRFVISAVGYQTLQKEVMITSDTKKIDFELKRQQLFMQPIEISASRAGSKAPFAKTNLSKAEIEKRNLGQDIPFILNQTPSVVVTSDAGNGIGYTGIRIRGTDATRINMTINGIPYNDAESQGIFFVNLPDLASSVSSIQIQRGVGTSTNGAGAFGATMNFSTNEFNEKAYAEVNNSVGSFDTRKHTVKAGTGLINNHFTVDARLSRIESAGFVDRAATDLQSFYLSGAYINKNTSIRLNIISGNEKTYQAWNGVPEAKLRNQPDQLLNHYYNNIGSLYFTKQDSINLFTSDPRRFNVYLYDNQTDNYRQDHYQFFVNHAFNSNLKANLTLFYSQGRGYYEQYRHNNRFSSYGLPDVTVGNTVVRRTDLIRQLWLDNDFYGGLYTLEYKKKKHSLIGGGGYTVYQGDHFGEIPWAAIGIAPRHRWYDFDATKTDFNLFAKWQYAITDALELFTDLQYRGVNYRFTGTRKFPTVNVNETFHFLNPKLGIHYRRNGYTAYASYAVGNKEPNRDDYERNETDPLPRREQLHNVEAGVSKNTSRYTWNANLFLMRYKDQLVLTGRINDVGDAVRVNVPNSYRIGIE